MSHTIEDFRMVGCGFCNRNYSQIEMTTVKFREEPNDPISIEKCCQNCKDWMEDEQ